MIPKEIQARNKNEKEKVGHTCQRVSVARNMKQNNAEAEKMGKNRRSKKANVGGKTASEPFVSNWRSTRKEKTSPQRFIFLNNCIVFKVQEFMYKNTVVLASAPQRKKKTEQKKGTNSGEEREKRKAKYRTE